MMMHSYFSMFIIMMLSGILSSMNVWVDNLDDIHISLNDIYMSLLMSGWMILFMALLDKNITISLIGICIIIISFIAIRTQLFINVKQYLLGMIPHHSMAITMSKKLKEKLFSEKQILNTKNNISVSSSTSNTTSNTTPYFGILELLNQIITSQRKEIEFMKNNLQNIKYLDI